LSKCTSIFEKLIFVGRDGPNETGRMVKVERRKLKRWIYSRKVPPMLLILSSFYFVL
jgi:hypothetical protein